MTTFDERERAFEQMFVHDEELRFRALARRNKLLGAWACERLGLSGDEASRYMEAFVRGVVGRQDDAALIEKLRDDLTAKGVVASEAEIGAVLVQLGAKAAADIRNDIRGA
jgi:hypothetical protein